MNPRKLSEASERCSWRSRRNRPATPVQRMNIIKWSLMIFSMNIKWSLMIFFQTETESQNLRKLQHSASSGSSSCNDKSLTSDFEHVLNQHLHKNVHRLRSIVCIQCLSLRCFLSILRFLTIFQFSCQSRSIIVFLINRISVDQCRKLAEIHAINGKGWIQRQDSPRFYS